MSFKPGSNFEHAHRPTVIPTARASLRRCAHPCFERRRIDAYDGPADCWSRKQEPSPSHRALAGLSEIDDGRMVGPSSKEIFRSLPGVALESFSCRIGTSFMCRLGSCRGDLARPAVCMPHV